MINHLAQVDIGTKLGVPYGRTVGFGGFISVVLNNFIIFSGLTLFFMLLVGGLMVIFGSNSDNSQALQQGKNVVTAALIGFVVVFSAYWIIQIVQTVSGVPITNPGF